MPHTTIYLLTVIDPHGILTYTSLRVIDSDDILAYASLTVKKYTHITFWYTSTSMSDRPTFWKCLSFVYLFDVGDPVIRKGDLGYQSHHIAMLAPIQDLDFKHHISCFFVFSELRSEVIVCFVDIGGIVDHHYLNFLLIIHWQLKTYIVYWLILKTW